MASFSWILSISDFLFFKEEMIEATKRTTYLSKMFCLKLKWLRKEKLVLSSAHTKYLQESSSKKFLFKTFARTEDGSNMEWVDVFSVFIVEGSERSEGCCYQRELSFVRGGFSASRLKNASSYLNEALFSSLTSSICLRSFSVAVDAFGQGKTSVLIFPRSSL